MKPFFPQMSESQQMDAKHEGTKGVLRSYGVAFEAEL